MFDRVTQRALPSSWTVDLHLVRHGAVDTGGERLAYGHTDLEPSSEGVAQAAALRGALRERLAPPDVVFSSDLRRCRAMAETVAAAWRAPLVLDPELREQHMGAWEGRSWRALTAEDEPRVQAWWGDFARARPPGGESLADVQARAVGWWRRHLPDLVGRRVLVVTHLGVLRGLMCHLLGVPLDDALRLAPPPGSHSWMTVAEAGGVLHTLGERPTAPVPSTVRSGPPRVALSGSAGTGKTTLGTALARALDVPFVPEGMRARLERGLDVHALGRGGLRDLMTELWAEQVAAEDAAASAHGGFVSDRSSIDFAAFWLHYGYYDDVSATAEWLAARVADRARYDRIVLLPWGVVPLVEDGVRTTNPYVQRAYQSSLEGLALREVETWRLLVMPGIDGVDARCRYVLERL